MLLSIFELSLPLKNPVLVFSLLLFIILFAPLLFNRIKVPHLIGLIMAGAIIGEYGLNLMLRSDGIVLFGTVGLLYIMFLAGLEIDIADFKKNSGKSLVFGLYTFVIPMTLGTTMSYYFLQLPILSSVLLASMFASHTLIAYPLISKMGIGKNRAVNITVGGTMITDTLALLVLAVIVGMTKGTVDTTFWATLSVSVILFAAIILFGFPLIGRWFFKHYDDNISQYIFVLGMLFLGAFLAEAAGVEAIIGAFLAGLALNRLIPHTSPLMNRIEFVGNALFIPIFLIGVGMLVDYRAFIKDLETIKVAIAMTITATTGKFLAAWLTQKTFGFNKDERRLIFGLSNAQAAATLAAVTVGYKIILNQPEIDAAAAEGLVIAPVRLLNESVLNGTIVMILFTCTIASIAAQRSGQKIALKDNSDEESKNDNEEKILLALSDEKIAEELVNTCMALKSKSNKNGLYALHVIEGTGAELNGDKAAKKLHEIATDTAAAADNYMHELLRYDTNSASGISNVAKEQKTTDLILGINPEKGISERFLENITNGILNKTNCTTMLCKPLQPLGTIKRQIIIIPDKAEREIGFPFWLIKVWNLGRNTGAKLVFFAGTQTTKHLKEINKTHPVEAEFLEFANWEDFLILSREIHDDDGIVIIMSRKDYPSYTVNMAKIPHYLNKYFNQNNYIIIYPIQAGVSDENYDYKNPSFMEPIERLDDLSKTIGKIFKRK